MSALRRVIDRSARIYDNRFYFTLLNLTLYFQMHYAPNRTSLDLSLRNRGRVCVLHLRCRWYQRRRLRRPWKRSTSLEPQPDKCNDRKTGWYQEERWEENEVGRVPADLQPVQKGQGARLFRGLCRVSQALRQAREWNHVGRRIVSYVTLARYDSRESLVLPRKQIILIVRYFMLFYPR